MPRGQYDRSKIKTGRRILREAGAEDRNPIPSEVFFAVSNLLVLLHQYHGNKILKENVKAKMIAHCYDVIDTIKRW